MEQKLYWLWLTLKQSLSPRLICGLIEAYGSPEAVYNETKYDKTAVTGSAALRELKDKSMTQAESAAARMRELGGRIITIDEDEYPRLLKNSYSPPCVLYIAGEQLDWDKHLTIAVVGTRSCSEYGKRAAETIAYDLAKRGVTIVSGMARGIDSLAGEAALSAGAKTIAVLGSGVDVIYPYEMNRLYDAICANGAIVSEFPPGTKPFGYNFPRRNRIIAGLSYGTLVVQAPRKSGALITAECALDNNRDIFAVPGDIFDINNEGTNSLLNMGAKAVACADDVIEEYEHLGFTAEPAETDAGEEKRSRLDRLELNGLSETEIRIVHMLNERIMHADEIARSLELGGAETGSMLTMLEISGFIKRTGDNRYDLN